jgi:hypothetical protein
LIFLRSREGKRFFFEKKKQKTFIQWLYGAWRLGRTFRLDSDK